MMLFVAFFANLCPLQRASSTSIAFQVNSDSTRTFGQAQSSSSDAVAEQLRQEIGSLRAKAAQVPCPYSHYSSFCIVFLSRLLDKMGSQYQTNIQLQCDATRYSSSKKSLLKLRRGRYDAMSAGLPVYPGENGQMFQKLLSIGISGRLKMLRQLPLLKQQRQEIESLREQSLEVRASVLQKFKCR